MYAQIEGLQTNEEHSPGLVAFPSLSPSLSPSPGQLHKTLANNREQDRGTESDNGVGVGVGGGGGGGRENVEAAPGTFEAGAPTACEIEPLKKVRVLRV
jgi:hypothetical protein